MTAQTRIEGMAAPLPVGNLDTDQIMPKQFLRRIDKAGLAEGLLYDMRFDPDGKPRSDFVLNRPEYAAAEILVAGPNFGCGSSREHAVWGLMQYGIRAVIAPSFGEIFYSNAMNNGLMLAALAEADVEIILADVSKPEHSRLVIDVASMSVRSRSLTAPFSLSERHRRMFVEGLDMVGATLAMRDRIDAFAAGHWRQRPWLKDIASMTKKRLA
ncbi:3-isopropylmalate dehydratase small subunit [Chromobacterium sp. CV08]|uniref:3-isopropylmalate dehydratase small subunit n=1 Tax=Chromobacterium sp. CV08 TaxID=3133274 RepID=UPI003DA9BCFF